VKAYKPSQYLKHAVFGFGTVTESDTERTTIDFEIHGKKKFVTNLLQVELLDSGPAKPVKRGRKKAAKAAVLEAAEVAAG
jgi:hypothetical protein